MLDRLRSTQTRLLRPLARWLVGLGVRPDAVTWLGALAVVSAALICFPNGWLWQGALLTMVASVSDMLDGHMARELPDRDQRWGNFLDASLDRIADAAILGGLAWHLALDGRTIWAVLMVVALVFAQVTSYVKARAEAVGATADVGVVTRADRIALACLGALLSGLGVPFALETTAALLLAGGVVTVVQRFVTVHRQLTRD